MTLALIIYIVVALLIVLLINVFLRKRKTSQSVRQPNPSHIKQILILQDLKRAI
ncbi:hypothetical protein [Staphylococcus sp. HMSC070A02]|uniref:hypothetical protein n=1 Tax=Staphylococcus sp. HMSC070A02 TaxID=1739523 RepID=UPI000A4C4C02